MKIANEAVPHDGVVYRSTAPNYSNPKDLLSGEGCRLHGGRWNPMGIRAVYGGCSPETAMAETLAYARYFGIPEHALMPRVFNAISVKLSKILDLTDSRIRKSLGVSKRMLTETDWRSMNRDGRLAITQIIGHNVSEVGLEGLAAPSAAHNKGVIIAIFVSNLEKTSFLRLLLANEPYTG